MKPACDWILAQGGVEATRVFTRLWLALSGRWSWDDLPVIPPELIYLPSWFPLNIYDWGLLGCGQTIVALAVVRSLSARAGPIGISIDELKTGGPHGRAPRPRRSFDARPLPDPRPSADPWSPRLRRPGQGPASLPTGQVGQARRLAQRRAEQWIRVRQEAGRIVGRHPAALGVGDHRAVRARPRPRARRHAAQGRRRRWRDSWSATTAGPPVRPGGGVPVAGMGHRAGDAHPGGSRRAGRRRGDGHRRRASSSARRWGGGATGGSELRRQSGRVGVGAERPLPGRR